MNKHIISKDKTLLEALSQINDLAPEPLVLFVVDEEQRMVGTLTDGDSRRALIAGASVNDKAEMIMHRGFNYMRDDDIQNVLELRHQKELLMKLVPILDAEKHIVDIINLKKPEKIGTLIGGIAFFFVGMSVVFLIFKILSTKLLKYSKLPSKPVTYFIHLVLGSPEVVLTASKLNGILTHDISLNKQYLVKSSVNSKYCSIKSFKSLPEL